MSEQLVIDGALITQAEIVNRAIHTFDLLFEWGIVADDDSNAALLTKQSHFELKRLLSIYEAQGVNRAALEL